MQRWQKIVEPASAPPSCMPDKRREIARMLGGSLVDFLSLGPLKGTKCNRILGIGNPGMCACYADEDKKTTNVSTSVVNVAMHARAVGQGYLFLQHSKDPTRAVRSCNPTTKHKRR